MEQSLAHTPVWRETVEPRTPTQPASQESSLLLCNSLELGRGYPVWHEYLVEALWPVLTFLERRVALSTGDLLTGHRRYSLSRFIDFSLALVFFLVPFPEAPECSGEG